MKKINYKLCKKYAERCKKSAYKAGYDIWKAAEERAKKEKQEKTGQIQQGKLSW